MDGVWVELCVLQFSVAEVSRGGRERKGGSRSSSASS